MQRAREAWGDFERWLRAFFRLHWKGALLLRDKLRLNEDAFHLILAGAVGVIGGATSLVYHACGQTIKWIAFGQTGGFLDIARTVPAWKLVVVPTVGGLIAGLIIYFGLRLIGNPGLSNLLEVIATGDGRLPLRTALVNAASSLVSISTGASIGREGLITQVTAAVSSRLGLLAKWPPYRLRLLIACGAAAGLAAGLNAPVAGAVFAAQIILGNFSMNLFAPLVFSSVVASVIARNPLTPHAWVQVPEFDFTSLSQLPWFLPLGIAAGFCGASFLKLLRLSDKFTSSLSVPLYLRIMVAGAGVGAMALLFPQVLGNGHEAANEILSKEFGLKFLLGLFIAKFIATLLTVALGTVGGVFTPTLFLGAALGSLFAGCLHQIGWGANLPQGAFALVGMGGVLAATTHSPLLAMIMIFEMSLNYSLMPPLMLACVVATLVSRSFHPESVYTEPLRRKGLELTRESVRLGAATEKTVGDIMQPPVTPLLETATFQQISERFLTSSNNFLPVVDERGRMTGIVALHDLKNFLNTSSILGAVIAADVMRDPPACLTPNQRLSDVLPILLASELRNVPVVSTLTDYKLIGAVSRSDALGTLSEAISASKPAQV
ncbi:MAG TPA: chloride channel protein [Candidatus Limnocylindria bacterium]|nr:chloride channel protein [Candidatus Limnocylindria bacterium]